jgi:hypothetical protein
VVLPFISCRQAYFVRRKIGAGRKGKVVRRSIRLEDVFEHRLLGLSLPLGLEIVHDDCLRRSEVPSRVQEEVIRGVDGCG